MANSSDTNMTSFLSAAGGSLTGAHQELGTGLEFATGMTLASADLEIKAAVHSQDGQLSIATLSSTDVLQSDVNPDLLSTVRLSFVATAVDRGGLPGVVQAGAEEKPAPPEGEPETGTGTVLTEGEVQSQVLARPDVQQLQQILGTLEVQSAYVPAFQRWLVVVRDWRGRVVRELVLADERAQAGAGAVAEAGAL